MYSQKNTESKTALQKYPNSIIYNLCCGYYYDQIQVKPPLLGSTFDIAPFLGSFNKSDETVVIGVIGVFKEDVFHWCVSFVYLVFFKVVLIGNFIADFFFMFIEFVVV